MSRSRSGLLAELGTVAGSPRKAKETLDRAAQLVGLQRKREWEMDDLLLICEALAAEGGPVQEWAEDLAADILRSDWRGNAPGAA